MMRSFSPAADIHSALRIAHGFADGGAPFPTGGDPNAAAIDYAQNLPPRWADDAAGALERATRPGSALSFPVDYARHVAQGAIDLAATPGNLMRGTMNPPGSDAAAAEQDLAWRTAQQRAPQAALAMVGGGMPMAEAGALGMAGGRLAADSLPMDAASRLARAQSQGYRTSMPVYHGTGQDFSSFRAVPTTAKGMETPGVSLALDPQVANEYAAARGSGQASPQVYPLLHRADRPASVALDGTETQGEVAGTLRDLFEAGHDAVMLRNYSTPGGQTGKNIIIVRDANQLRSPNAAFDPAKIGSPDILAGLGAAGIAGGGLGAASALQPTGSDMQRATGGRADIEDALRIAHRATGGPVVEGPIGTAVPGRTDHLPMQVRSGAYVLPADVVSSLGEGNTLAGHEVLNRMFNLGPYGGPKSFPGAMPKRTRQLRANGGSVGQPVDIAAAGGEYVVPPEAVAKVGAGDVSRGHAILDQFVHHARKKHIKTLKSLPGPAKK